jgi:hypothetical protein
MITLQFLLITQHFYKDQMKQDEMGRSGRMDMRDERRVQNFGQRT